jgi:hypothetical protein
MTMALLVQETALAWTLAEAVKPHLSAIERSDVFMAIGAGETFAAIRGLVTSVAAKRIPLRPDLAQQCVTWLDAYVGHKDERYFRRLIEDYLVPCSSHVPETVRVNRVPTTPIRSAGCVCGATSSTRVHDRCQHRHQARNRLSVRILLITSSAATL